MLTNFRISAHLLDAIRKFYLTIFHELTTDILNSQAFLLYLWRIDNAVLEAKRYSLFYKRSLS